MLTLSVCCIAALVAGFVDSIAGGGGMITQPAMLLVGVPPHAMLGTNKFATTLGTGLALVNFARSNLVVWRVAALGVVFSLLGAYIGAELALLVDSATLGKVIVALLPLGLLFTLLPKKERKPPAPGAALTGGANMQGPAFWLLVPLASALVGLYDGFFGPGTGSVFILVFHWLLGMGLIYASATAKVFNLASNVGALVGFLWGGQVLFALALPMAACNMLGNWLGSRLAIRQGSGLVRRILAVTLSLLVLTLIWHSFFRA